MPKDYNKLGAVIGRVLFAGFDADGGGNPNDGDEGDKAQGHARMLKGERDRDQIDEEGEPVFALDGGVFCLKFACVAQTAADGQAEEEEAEAGQNHGRDVDGYREGVHLLFEDVGGKEGEQRETKEEAEVGIENAFVGLVGAVDEMVVIYPINADEGKGDEIEAEGGENGAEAGEAVLVRDFELKHHDGDDDGDDSVGEGFEAGWGGDVMGHEVYCRGVFVLAEAYNGDCADEGSSLH
jgi:hypothetical protein